MQEQDEPLSKEAAEVLTSLDDHEGEQSQNEDQLVQAIQEEAAKEATAVAEEAPEMPVSSS